VQEKLGAAIVDVVRQDAIKICHCEKAEGRRSNLHHSPMRL